MAPVHVTGPRELLCQLLYQLPVQKLNSGIGTRVIVCVKHFFTNLPARLREAKPQGPIPFSATAPGMMEGGGFIKFGRCECAHLDIKD